MIKSMDSKKRRIAYSAEFKLTAIEFAEKNTNRAASRKFGVVESNIRLWRKEKAQLQKMPSCKQSLRGKQAHYPELEKELAEWVENKRKNGYIVTTLHVKLQAKKMSQDEKYGVCQSFKFSNGWCQRFFSRYSLALRQKTKNSQKLPSDLDEKIVQFYSFIIELRNQHDFDLSQIGNMDEIPLIFDMSGTRTLGNKNIYVRTAEHEKHHCTVVMCCLADGTKLNPMVIFKRKTIPKSVIFSSGVIVHCHPKGLMDREGIDVWLRKVWNKRPGAHLNKPAMLVWDKFRAHLTEPVKHILKDMKTYQAVIPDGLSSILQPLDVVLKKPFKNEVRKHWMSWISSDEMGNTTGDNLKKPDLATIVTWVKIAWNSLPEHMVSKSFLKTGISNKLDGTEDYLLWNCQDATLGTSTSLDEEDDEMIGQDSDEKLNEECLLLVEESDDESHFDDF